MKASIDPEKSYWASFNRFELRLPGQCVLDCSHSGPCDDDIAYWVTKVAAMAAADRADRGPEPDGIRAELKEYGAWDDEELEDDEANMRRLVWIAACNVAEESEPCAA